MSHPAPTTPRAPSVLAWWRTHPTVVAAAVYAVLALALVGQGLAPGRTLSGSDSLLGAVPWQSARPADVPGLGTNFELADSVNVFQPFLQYTRARFPAVPLWNPHIMAGRPFLADGQSAVLSPFSLPSYVVDFFKSLALVAMLKLFFGALGVFVLARLLGMRFGGALLSGVVFAFGTFFVVWLAWPLASVFALIGWTLALAELLARRPGALPAAGLAVVLALQFFGGHPESSFHLVFVTTCFFLFRLLVRRRREGLAPGAFGPPVLAFAMAGLGGAALASLALGPFLELLLHSGDLARRGHTPPSFWPRKYLGALFLHDYWGRPTQVDLEPFTVIRGWYAGALTLMLGATALIVRRTAERVGIAAFAVFCAFMVLGLPPVFGLMTKLPGFSTAHNERLLIYFLLGLSLLAGWGLDDLSAGQRPRLRVRRLVIGAAAVILCVPGVWMVLAGTLTLDRLPDALNVAWGFAHPPLPPPGVSPLSTPTATIVRSSALLQWLPLAGAGLALIALRLRGTRRLGAGVLVALSVALVAADLFRANMGFNPAIARRNATPPLTGAIRYLQSRRPNRFVGISTLLFTQPLPADLAMAFGLYDARGYDFPVEKHFDALWRRSVAPTVGDFTQPVEFAGATPEAVRALSLLSVSDLLAGPKQPAPTAPGLRLAYHGLDGDVYANPRALPRVLIVDHQRSVRGERSALDAVTAPGFDGRGVVVTQRPFPGVPEATAAPPAAGARTRLVSYRDQRVLVDAISQRPGVLVLTDAFYPGWKATVDGHATPIQRVDYTLRGVALPAGRHVVAFRYAPRSWRVGWIVSMVALLGVVAATLVGLRDGRRRRRRVD